MDIQKRLEEFFRRLLAAPPAANADEGLFLVGRLMEEVEDEFCPIPRQQPIPEGFTGRMYRPSEGMTKRLQDGSLIAVARRHTILCSPNGDITIYHRPSMRVVLTKPGKWR